VNDMVKKDEWTLVLVFLQDRPILNRLVCALSYTSNTQAASPSAPTHPGIHPASSPNAELEAQFNAIIEMAGEECVAPPIGF
jgi:hypothetical protein